MKDFEEHLVWLKFEAFFSISFKLWRSFGDILDFDILFFDIFCKFSCQNFWPKVHKTMSQFQLEMELQNALRLDTSINFNSNRSATNGSRRTNENGDKTTPSRRARSTGRSNTSLLNGSLNRSRVLCIQPTGQPGLRRSSSSGRLLSPGRTLSPGIFYHIHSTYICSFV